jgi:hypothetical protein
MAEMKSEYCITIDFKKDSERPSRVFETMANLIKSFEELDKDLIKSIDSKIEPVVMLENVETGSIKAWLSSVLKGLPDDAVKDLNWKKVVGTYLVKAKYIIINKIDGRTDITDANIIEELRAELVDEAKKTDIKMLPNYTPIQLPKLIENIDRINKALEPLSNEDKASLTSQFGEANFNLNLNFTTDEIEDLITKERLESTSVMILKVKKPDYLGTSMWDFKHGSRVVPAKVLDNGWLNQFQSRQIDIRPGDSLRADVKTIVKYGFDMELIGTTYEIIRVLTIIQSRDDEQHEIDF